MNEFEFRRRFPQASEDTFRKNVSTGNNPPQNEAPQLERHPGDESVAAPQVQKTPTGRVLVRIESRRINLLDEDNLCEKFLVDCCRYAGLIPGDAPHQAHIEARQIQVATKEEEETVLSVEPM
jgi:hypothetical protein